MQTGTVSGQSDGMLPSGDQIFLDHVAHFVADADAARAALNNVGFTITPDSLQTNRGADGTSRPAGTGNLCAMLEEGYIEVLYKTADTPLSQELDTARARYSGLHLIAFATSDAQRESARLAGKGFRVRPVVNLRRPIALERGTGEAAFSVARVEPGEMKEGRIQFLTHHTPELVWQKRWLAHENGAQALVDVVIAVDDVAEAADRFGLFLGVIAGTTPFGRAFLLGRGGVQLMPARALEPFLGDMPRPPFIALCAIRVASRDRVRSHLSRNGLGSHSHGAMLVAPFPPALGQGAWAFVEEPRDLPWRQGS
jgi:hypothetical protein